MHARHIHYPSILVPKEWMKECFLGMDLCFLEKCYGNLLFVLDCTIRKVLHVICTLRDEVIHKSYWKGMDSIIETASYLSNI